MLQQSLCSSYSLIWYVTGIMRHKLYHKIMCCETSSSILAYLQRLPLAIAKVFWILNFPNTTNKFSTRFYAKNWSYNFYADLEKWKCWSSGECINKKVRHVCFEILWKIMLIEIERFCTNEMALWKFFFKQYDNITTSFNVPILHVRIRLLCHLRCWNFSSKSPVYRLKKKTDNM